VFNRRRFTYLATIKPNEITALDTAMTSLFHIEHQRRGASEFLRSASSNIMFKFTQLSLIVATMVLLVAGCAHSPRMSKTDVVRAAGRAATEAGYKLEGYKEPEAHFEFVRKDGSWTVFYVMKPPTPVGGHFQVWVNDKTGKTRVMQGE